MGLGVWGVGGGVWGVGCGVWGVKEGCRGVPGPTVPERGLLTVKAKMYSAPHSRSKATWSVSVLALLSLVRLGLGFRYRLQGLGFRVEG